MVKRSRWWSRSRGLPHDTYAAWAASLAADPGRQVRILAWARLTAASSPVGFCVGSPSVLSFGRETSWTHVGWHRIEVGGWDQETGRLSWTLYGGERGAVELGEPGRLPELFRERVAASIVLEKFVPIIGNRGVLISGRRDLGSFDAPITWNSTLTSGLSWQTDGVQAAADEAVAMVRTEYDMG